MTRWKITLSYAAGPVHVWRPAESVLDAIGKALEYAGNMSLPDPISIDAQEA